MDSSRSTISLIESSSSSDSDECRSKKRKIVDYVENTVRFYDDDEFKAHFRISKTTTYMLIGMFIKIYIDSLS